MYLQVKLPLTHLDLAGLSDLSASVDLSALDSLLAVGLPCLLALVALPVCLARAAMLGLDCIAVRTQVLVPGPGRHAGPGLHSRQNTGTSAWPWPPCWAWTA